MKRRKGRHQETAPNEAKNRKYTSYEDEPLEEYEESIPAPTNLTKKFIYVFIILFLAVAGALAFFYVDVLTPENISHWFHYELLGKSEGDGYPVRFDGISVNAENFSLLDNSPIYCSDISVVTLNSNAGVYQNTQHAFAKPIMKTNGGYSIVYNSDATGYKILNRNSTLNSGNTERKLFDADVSSSGSYALLNYGDDYLSMLSVYKNDNTKRYSYSFADYYVNRVSLSNDNNRAALSGISANNGSPISVIYIIAFNQENYLQKYEIENTYFYDIVYLENGNVFAVGDTSACYIDVASGKKTDLSYNGKTLTDYCLKRNYGILLSLSDNPDGRNCDVLSYNDRGSIDFQFNTGNKILSLDYNQGTVAALFPTNVALLDEKGKKLAEKNVDADIKTIRLCSDSETVYMLGKSTIDMINFSKDLSDK